MSEKKPVSLMGRLAVQLKLISVEQLQQATALQGRHPDKKLGQILVEQGWVSPVQLQKLQKVQRAVIANHRAKQAAQQAAPGPEPGAARASAPAAGEPAAEAPAAAPEPPGAAPAPEPPAAPSEPLGHAPHLAAAPAAADLSAAPPPQPEPQPEAEAEAPPAQAGAGTGDSLALRFSAPADAEGLGRALGEAVAAGASDVHVHAGAPIRWRVHGRMEDRSDGPLSPAQAEALVLGALSPAEQAELARHGELDLCVSLDGVGRFRTNVYRQQRGFDAVFRAIPEEPPTLEALGLPDSLARFTHYHQGMVLVTGPAGCGKSSTLAALVNLINEERDEHILTIEDPIETVHPSKRCLVNQRHAGRHTESFARALRGALREDPDVIVIGELRDLETISLAMTAAETGHFVLATLHTSNAVRTINRMIGAFPSNEQEQVRTMLSESLRAVVSQRLVATADGQGRVPALEVLVLNKAIANLVREQKTVQIRSSIQTGSREGMCLLEQSLNELVQNGSVSKQEALRWAEDPKLITAG